MHILETSENLKTSILKYKQVLKENKTNLQAKQESLLSIFDNIKDNFDINQLQSVVADIRNEISYQKDREICLSSQYKKYEYNNRLKKKHKSQALIFWLKDYDCEGDYGKEIILPKTVRLRRVTSIGQYAFDGCNMLKSIIVPNSITCIMYNAFNNCSGLTNITIAASVIDIGSKTFNGCILLTTVNYTGTKKQWDAISKDGWNNGSAIKTINCADGTITI